jgi:HAE1 family hydrophobic/amphiphilic exporter-1/multidrug efflux pump
MTSMAFIGGVIPLVVASGAGAASRQSIGTGVFGGMLAATFLAIFFVPLFYTVVRKLIPGRPAPPTMRHEAVESFEEPEPVGAAEEV